MRTHIYTLALALCAAELEPLLEDRIPCCARGRQANYRKRHRNSRGKNALRLHLLP